MEGKIKIALFLLCSIVSLVSFAWVTATFVFSGIDHSKYDLPEHPSVGKLTAESAEHQAVSKMITEAMAVRPREGRREQLQMMRKELDDRGTAWPTNVEIRPVDVDGVSAEWVIAPNAVPDRRLLFIHGGGYMMGSSKSHRPITSRLSEISNSAVLAIDYRLMPEHSRMMGIEDCRTAYAWLLKNGPNNTSTVETLIVAGDSAGGNLALSTIAWARDYGLRAANAVIVLSPQTDSTFSGQSIMRNIDSDIMQGASFAPVAKAPKFLLLWGSFLMNRINPRNPIVSPLFGNLSNLPPTLIQVSQIEVFYDDAVRYVNKANAQGSYVLLQSWPFVMHVWHGFDVPEADEAYDQIEAFIRANTKGAQN